MHREQLYFGLFLLLISSFSCRKESGTENTEYPFVIISQVKNISKSGITATAEIKSLGNDSIIDYGFVWSDTERPTIDDYRLSLSSKPKIGLYSADIINSLKDGIIYFIRPYIQSTKYITYGTFATFNSLGSSPPVIIDFYPRSGKIGSTVKISGDYFNSNAQKNIVHFGDAKANVISASANELVVEVPYLLNNCKISIEFNNYKSESASVFEIITPWLKISTPLTSVSFDYSTPYCFSINGKGYFCFERLWEYNPQNNVWTEKSKFPGFQRYNGVAFSINNKGYMGLGNYFGSYASHEFWEYDPELDSWTRKADFPGVGILNPTSFVINNYGYVCLGLTETINTTTELWKYDQSSDTWLKKSDFPGSGRDYAFGIAIGNKAYVGFGYNNNVYYKDFYEYEPISDLWIQKGTYPGKGIENIQGFSTNNTGYIGLGVANSKSWCTDFWQYSPLTNEWKRIVDCPVGSNKRFIVINNYGYLFNIPDLWQCDPSKI